MRLFWPQTACMCRTLLSSTRRGSAIRTDIEIDDDLLAAARAASGATTSDKDFRVAHTAPFSFDVVSLADVDSAVDTAQLYGTLRRRGVPVRKTIDMIIASYFLWHDEALLFSDRYFEPFVTHLGLLAS